MSGALAGIIAVASGLDIYFPALTFLIAIVAGLILKPCADALEAFGIDDAVGAVTVHGTIGVFGVVVLGIFGAGYPALFVEGAEQVNLVGQIVGALVCVLCGFVPGYAVSLFLSGVGMLRVPSDAEIAGLDPTKIASAAYPEGIPASQQPSS
tara:strand:- start:45 stop:500 length:456 start_codon:yes stop_codon:yes gene_type:complete